MTKRKKITTTRDIKTHTLKQYAVNIPKGLPLSKFKYPRRGKPKTVKQKAYAHRKGGQPGGSYCMTCKKKTSSNKEKIHRRNPNGTILIKSECATCGGKKASISKTGKGI